MGTHLVVRRRAGGRLLFAALALLAALSALAANALPASALGNPVLLTITVAPTVVSVPSGETQQFTATGHYSDLSTKDLTDTVTWSSSSTSVATVSNTSGSQGLATAKGTGPATIEAADGSISGTSAMTVLPAVLLSVTVSPSVKSIPLGESAPFVATGHYSDGTTSNLTDTATWSTSSSSVATASNASGSQGTVTATGTGAATITATDPSTSLEGTAAVTVLPAALLTVTVSPSVASIPAGETEQFTATGHYSDGSTQNLTDSVTWASSSTGTATVSNSAGSQGEVTAVATGAATISATDPTTSIEGLSAVTVIPAVLLAVTVSPLAASIPAGETEQFTATGHYSNGSTQNLTDSVTWGTSSTSTATVSNTPGSQGQVTAVATGAATVTATDPTTSIEGTAAVTVLPAVLLAVSVSPLAASIPAGETEQFTATGHYSDGSTQNLTDSVTWASSSTGTATVSNSAGSQGEVTAVATGAATISATDPTTSIEGTAAVTVLPAVLLSVTVSPAAASIPAGETEQFTATGHYSDGSTQNLTDSVTWASSSASTATVSNTSGSQGQVTAVAEGAATISATDPTTSIEGVSVVTVLPAVLLAVTVSPPAASIPAGETEQFTATGHYSDGTTENLTDSVTWTSSDTSTATASNASGSQGQVTAVATGAATVTATDPTTSIEGTAAVTVLPAVLLAVTVSPPSASIPAGESEQFTATGHYSDGSTQNLTDSVTWASSSDGTATVSNVDGSQGQVTAVATGAATITATDPTTSIEGAAAVTVLPAVLLAVTVSPLAASIPAGETQQFNATGHYSDGSTQNLTDSVTWASSSDGTATVSNVDGSQGVVTAVATGAATVTATDPTTSIEGASAVTVLPAVLLAITVKPIAASIPAGESEQFTATGHYSDGTTQDLTDSVTWASSDDGTATVSDADGSQGVVTAVATGAATITATDPTTSIEGASAVTVLPAVLLAITVKPIAASIPAGESEQFTATGHYSDGTTQDLTDSVTWGSSDLATATVSNSAGSQGEVTAVATGAAVISATDPTTSIEGTATVTVLPAVLLAVTVSPVAASIPAGESEQFTATGLYSDGTTQNLTDSVTWASSDQGTATVSNASGSQGEVTAVAIGATTISATDPTTSIEGTATVTVLPAVLLAITVSPAEASVALHDVQQFKATGLFSDGTTSDLTDSLRWTTSDSSEATISNAPGSQGLATGVSPGEVVITATDPSTQLFGAADLDVTSPKLTISPSSGPARTPVTVSGQGFTPGSTIKIVYKTGVAGKRNYKICTATVGDLGTFSCSGEIPRRHLAGAAGAHTVNAKVVHSHMVTASTSYTLTS